MKNKILLTSVLMFIAAASAVQITPGQQTNITSNTSDLQTQSSDLPLEFNTSNSTLFAEAPEGFPSQNGSITLNYTNSTQTLSAEIVKYSDWDLQVENFADNVSVGDTGRFGTVNFTQNGNVQANVEVSASGNLTEYLSFDDQFTLFPQNTIKKTVSYNIPRSTEFGEYTAQFNFTENKSGINETVNVSTVFEDNIAPVIDSTVFPDVMSTRSENFTAGVSENFKVSSVEAEIVREAEEEQENKTVLVNKTVGTESFERLGQEWRTEFSDTGNIGTYYYTLNVTDKAGNTATEKGSFQVKGLDAVEIINSNFNLSGVEPTTEPDGETKAVKKVFRLKEESPVEISLDSLTHSSSNSTLEDNIGVLKPGDDVATKFDGDSITVEEKGVYKLVVQSNKLETYSGVLKLDLVPQHLEVDNTLNFAGAVINPKYPEEGAYQIGPFSGEISYVYNGGAKPQSIVFEAETGNVEQCVGVDEFNQCLQGYSLGSIDSVKEENRKMTESVNNLFTFENVIPIGYKWQRNIMAVFMLVFLTGYIRSKNLAGRHVAIQPVKS